MNPEFSARAETRAGDFAQHADLGWVGAVLAEQRDRILQRWLDSARQQPFHEGQPGRAVADHIPSLFDAVVAVLQRSAPRWLDPTSLLQDAAVLQAAGNHARVRFSQGLEPADVVTEFRLLRQEIGRTLRVHLADAAPVSDILAAELLVHDALDGAITLALAALSRQVEEVRQEFLATTLHDVQQPLSTIKGRVQLTMRRLTRARPDIDQAINGLQTLVGEVDRLERMLGSLADASRLALGQFQLRRSPVDLAELVRESISRLPADQAERIRLNGHEQPIIGEWDRDLLERVLDNVLSNSVKYSPPAAAIDMSLEMHSGVAQLAVHDKGIGLSADELDQVFERYRRASGALQQGIRGQGLGLYLSRGVVDAHGGRMWLESPGPGFGATVFVRLPLAVPKTTS